MIVTHDSSITTRQYLFDSHMEHSIQKFRKRNLLLSRKKTSHPPLPAHDINLL